jgi:hypothetical protein
MAELEDAVSNDPFTKSGAALEPTFRGHHTFLQPGDTILFSSL